MQKPITLTLSILFLLMGIFSLPIFSQQITVDRFMGVNTLREDPVEKMKAVGFIREFHSWYLNEGNPSMVLPDFSPSYPNAVYRWDKVYQDLTYTRFDDFYEEIRNTNDIPIAPSFLGNLFQIVDPGRDTNHMDNHKLQEQKPIISGANSLDPASYIHHAAYLYHYAARYGHNTFSANDFNNIIVPVTHAKETPKTGMGLIEYMESWNEQDKWWWQGTHPNTFFSPEEYSAMLSADYDGHNQTLGTGIGIKNADPNMKVVMGGLADADIDYIRAMVEWAKTNRPANASLGQLPFQVLNIHHYFGNNPSFLQSSSGISPEQANLRDFLKSFVDYRDSLETAFNTELEIWLSEFGYDTYGVGAMGAPVVIAPAIGSNDSYEVQGQWIIRCYLEAMAAEIDRAILFFLRDEQTPYKGLFTSSGLLENAVNNYKPKNSWFYTYTMKNVLTDMVFDTIFIVDPNKVEDEHNIGFADSTRIYRFKDPNGGNKKVYAIWSGTSSDKKYNVEFDIADANGGTLVNMELPSIWGVSSTITAANPIIEVSERPLFIIVDGSYFSAQSCAANPVIENETCSTLNFRLNAPDNSGSYQLWYMTGNFNAVDFSHRLATLIDEAIVPSDSVITITGLQASTTYTFFLFPEGVGQNETAKTCTTTGITTANSCKITIDPAWVFDDYKNTLNSDGLFDEQNDFDPVCNPTMTFPNSLWGFNFDLNDSMNLSLDLQAYYYIDAFILHDEGSRGFFTIQIADSPNGPWTTVTDYLTTAYNEWISIVNVIPADKPVRYLRFIAEKNDAAKVGELYICGRLSAYNPDILPGIATNGLVKNITCESLTLEWNHPFDRDIKEYKILEGNTILGITPFNSGVQSFSLNNLTEATTFNFSIITIDSANQESVDTLKLSGATLGGINSCKIPLDVSMIFDYYNQLNNAKKLVDEQGIYDPLCNPAFIPSDLWGFDFSIGGSEKVSLDLQEYYEISDVILHDGGGLSGNVKIQIADSQSGPWSTVIDYNTVKFNDWITFSNPIPGNQPVRYIRIEASPDDAVAIGEFFLCGTIFKACVDSMGLPNPILQADTFRAGKITSAAIIDPNIAVGYFAETSITLLDGFQTQPGVEFLAKIETCPINFVNSNTTFDFARRQSPLNPFNKGNNLNILPNPFQQQTTLEFHLEKDARVHLAIFDATGRMVKTLINSQLNAGNTHRATFVPENTKGGFYFARLQIGTEVVVKKMVVIQW